MLTIILLLAAVLSLGSSYWLTTKPVKSTPPPNSHLRQLLRDGMVLTDAMIKARHAESYIMNQTHEALNAWEAELIAAIEKFSNEEKDSCSPV